MPTQQFTWQNGLESSRLTMAEIMDGVEVMEGTKPKKVAYHTVRYVNADGTVRLRFRKTDIIYWYHSNNEAESSLSLHMEGWNTKTTRCRLSRFNNVGASIGTNKGLTLAYYGPYNNRQCVPYFEGITFDLQGHCLNPETPFVDGKSGLLLWTIHRQHRRTITKAMKNLLDPVWAEHTN